MICTKCGKQIDHESKYCRHCGAEVSLNLGNEQPPHPVYTNHSNYHHNQNKKNNSWKGWVAFVIIIGFIIIASNSSQSQNTSTAAGVTNPAPPDCSNPPNGQTYNSLANGSQISSNSTFFDGQGTLKITNGTNDDAVVKVIDTDTNSSVGEYYIDANNEFTITGISDGNYDLYFSLGKNWSSTDNKFITCKSFSKFEDPFNYSTTDTQYTTYNVTLNPVIGGTATTTSIDENAFEKY